MFNPHWKTLCASSTQTTWTCICQFVQTRTDDMMLTLTVGCTGQWPSKLLHKALQKPNPPTRMGMSVRLLTSRERSMWLTGLYPQVLVDFELTEHPQQTWAEMEKLQTSGKVASLGISNFNRRRTRQILDGVSVPSARDTGKRLTLSG